MGPQNLQRQKDSKKEPPLRILSLDGGGVRGYSMLIIIETLMHQIYVQTHKEAPKEGELPKPADHFDLIVGSGTGGLIAVMLGRLRLDLETCKQLYIRTTKKVFETDKRIAGIPYTKTIFKASRLVKAIQEGVINHTIKMSEGNDESEIAELNKLISSPITHYIPFKGNHSRDSSLSSSSSKQSHHPLSPRIGTKTGEPNTLLYDRREDRTKTAVTAVYKVNSKDNSPTLLRSYISQKHPSETKCTIWEAGRATAALSGLYKEIQVGQSVFLDEGHGSLNPAPIALEEACVDEWPSREVGVFISIGSGKRPKGSDHDAQTWYESFLGDFVDAKKRIAAKIEACETTHKDMIREGLAKHNVNPENYFRFNVEVGVGEFEMNEWNRIAQINTSTRKYLEDSVVHSMNLRAASKLAKINLDRVKEKEQSLHHARRPSARSFTLPKTSPKSPPISFRLPPNIPPNAKIYDSRRSDNHNRNEIPDSLRVPQSPRSNMHPNGSNLLSRRKSEEQSRPNVSNDYYQPYGFGRLNSMSEIRFQTFDPSSILRPDSSTLPQTCT